MLANDVIREAESLRSFWFQRNVQFREWYKLILMEDKLAEEGMESVVSNEPRTFYQLALHLLTPSDIVYRVPIENIPPDQLDDASAVEKFLADVWLKLERKSLLQGRGGFCRELSSMLLLTGWCAVVSIVTENEILADVWNPAETFPEYSDDGLVRCAHIYQLTPAAAKRKAELKGWRYTPTEYSPVLYDYWVMDGDKVKNAIVLGNQLVKPLTVEPFNSIPIICMPVAGLPDRGAIITGTDWTRTVGQSILAANVKVYDYINKVYTMTMQATRDAVQSRWVETSSGEPKVKPEDLYKRGAVFHLGLGESLRAVETLPIPLELRTLIMDLLQMKQRGSVPDTLFGSVQQQISGYLMSQISGAATHILRPYQQGLKFVLEEMAQGWLANMKQYKLKPYGFKVPAMDIKVEAEVRLAIPGDLLQRISMAKALNPAYTISSRTVTDMLFPEIRSPIQEEARSRAEQALHHPVSAMISLITAFEEKAAIAEDAGDRRLAERYRTAIRAIEAQMAGTPSPQLAGTPQPPQAPPGGLPEAVEGLLGEEIP